MLVIHIEPDGWHGSERTREIHADDGHQDLSRLPRSGGHEDLRSARARSDPHGRYASDAVCCQSWRARVGGGVPCRPVHRSAQMEPLTGQKEAKIPSRYHPPLGPDLYCRCRRRKKSSALSAPMRHLHMCYHHFCQGKKVLKQ